MPLPEVGPIPYTLHTPGNIQNMDYSKLKVRDKGKNSNVKKIMSNKFVILLGAIHKRRNNILEGLG